jgi:hypothetical protein
LVYFSKVDAYGRRPNNSFERCLSGVGGGGEKIEKKNS